MEIGSSARDDRGQGSDDYRELLIGGNTRAEIRGGEREVEGLGGFGGS